MSRHHRGGRIYMAGGAQVHDQHVLSVRVAVLEAELAAETLRADRLEAERDDARIMVARLQITRLLEAEGYVDCDEGHRSSRHPLPVRREP